MIERWVLRRPRRQRQRKRRREQKDQNAGGLGQATTGDLAQRFQQMTPT
jgi:hypothetical protein